VKKPLAFFLSFFAVVSPRVLAQNLEEIGVKKGVDLSGSLNINSVSYYADGIDDRRDPFNWFATGNLNVKLFGYSAPFSFSYSNTNKSFAQPFNQFSFAPQYKWIKTYVGYNSMSFSPYTLSGHVFFGGGVEMTPGKWRVALMYGRLRKAVESSPEDTLHYTQASFKRMGYGIKVGYENNGNHISLNVFSARDDVNSVRYVMPESQITPQQNLATSFSFRKTFLQRCFAEAEYAISVMNTDLRANLTESDTLPARNDNFLKHLLPENPTSRYYDAINASVGYQGNWYVLSLKYERISPEYQTLGAYYFNNDVENITIVPSLKLLKGTLNIAGNVGIQHSNLDHARAATTNRMVSSLNANYVPNSKWNFGGSYSNFASYTNIRPQQDPFFQNKLDTLNFYQVSQNMTGTIVRMLGAKERPQSIMVNMSYQEANDQADYEGGDQQSDFKSANVSYSYSLLPSNMTLALAGNVYSNNAAGLRTLYWGPTFSVTKSFFDKTFKASMAATYNKTSGDNVKVSPVLSNRLNISYTPKPKQGGTTHSFSMGLSALSRLESTGQQSAYNELTGTFNYSYTF
jgi:hypothetical protein